MPALERPSPRRRAARALSAGLIALAALLLAAAWLRRPIAPPPEAPPPRPSSSLDPAGSPGPAPSAPASAPLAPSAPSAPSAKAAARAPRPLPEAELQKAVAAQAGALRARCWEGAQAAPGSSATAARVVVSLVIDRQGKVIRATASGAEAFPSLGPCVVSLARSWVFPAGYDETSGAAVLSFKTD